MNFKGVKMSVYIQIKELTKEIKHTILLDHINLELEKGKIYGLQGKNGSGKTLLLKSMCGLIRPTEGMVEVDGDILGKKRDFPKSVGALIENPGFISGYSAFKNLKILADIHKRITDEDIHAVLKELDLDNTGNKKFRHFSLGMKQKLGIAAAIMEEPELILLDEPTNALDEASVLNLRDVLRKRKENDSLLVIASHDSNELSLLADEIFVVENGKIIRSYIPQKEEVLK